MKVLTTCMLSTLIVALASVSQVRAQDGGTHIAVASPTRIFQQMQETQQKNKDLEAERLQLNAEEKKRVDELKDLQEQREKFSNKGTPEYIAKTNEMLEKRVQLQAWGELKKAELARRHKEETKAIFLKIQGMIAQVAQDKKIDLVLTDFSQDIPDDLEQVTPEQLHAIISQKNVLYASKALDISAEVTARLDAQFKK